MPKDTRKSQRDHSSPAPAPGTQGAPGRGTRAALVATAKARGAAESELGWPSKGVDYYSWLDADGTFRSSFTQPTDWGDSTQTWDLNAPGQMQSGNLQISEDDIGYFDHTGRFSWVAFESTFGIAMTGYADISPLTGNLGSTTMGDMLSTPSIFGPGWTVSYGFYDSGSGIGGLTDQDQFYVYATRDLSSWMNDLAISLGPGFTCQPLAVLALPGAHDSGMFDITAVAQLISSPAFVSALENILGFAVGSLAPSVILRAVINLSMTQKDGITGLLNLGIRYFDFRPGYCYLKLLPGIYHQHNFIPGYPYQAFLQDVLIWLAEHRSEIVVVSLNFQGFADPSMEPGISELDSILAAAQQTTKTQYILTGNKYDLGSSYASLVASNKRLIFVSQIGAPDDAFKYDSYTSAYTTADVDVIIRAIGAMTETEQAQTNSDYTVLQLQGTASGLGGGIFTSIATMSNASSPLMSTKPGFDNQTYPWVDANVPLQLSAGQLVVFLNDFVDNALTCAAIQITTQRMSQMPALWFIQTLNTGSSFLEMHMRSAVSIYQSGFDMPAALSPDDANNGRFMMVASDLWFIKTRNTGSGSVEVHQRTFISGYQSGDDLPVALSPGDADNGWFQMSGSDLWFIKTRNTGSGYVEVHQRTAASGYQSGDDLPTSLALSDADNGWYQIVGSDLWFIKTMNTGSGYVEVHQRTAASGYQSGLDVPTALSPNDAGNGWFQMVGVDLWFIKTTNTDSGYVEVHQRTAASGYQSGLDLATSVSPADAGNGPFQIGWPVRP